jgi:protein-L-isoaspartate(D-aspartate) O-methyltransferase
MSAQWRQHIITFPDRATAEQVATEHLRPALVAAAEAGVLRGEWFVRKPFWKLRYLADPDAETPVDALLDTLAGAAVTEWTLGIYEPETVAFGGTEGMTVAHDLFHHDSRHVLRRAPGRNTPTPLGACEVATILCQAMLRAAGLDWFEQGDVWVKVADLRPAPPEHPLVTPSAPLAAKMLRLMTLDARSLCDPQRNGPLVGFAPGWTRSNTPDRPRRPGPPRSPAARPAGCPRPPRSLPRQPGRNHSRRTVRPVRSGVKHGVHRRPDRIPAIKTEWSLRRDHAHR